MALWNAVCACHQLATHTTFVVKFSQETAPMASNEACLPPKAPKKQVDAKCMFRNWLGIRAMLWPRSFNSPAGVIREDY